MSLYVLVEGYRTEMLLYPAWIEILRPDLKRVRWPTDAQGLDYFLISGEGYPQLLNMIGNSILDINNNNSFTHFMIVVDAENDDEEHKRQLILDHIRDHYSDFDLSRVFVVVQVRTIETWLLANKRVVTRNPQDKILAEYLVHYNVSIHDPEFMPLHSYFDYHAQFHFDYLKRLFVEKHICYTKINPGAAKTKTYFNQLVNRSNQNHITSFKRFVDYMASLQ